MKAGTARRTMIKHIRKTLIETPVTMIAAVIGALVLFVRILLI
jgi:hypothetical protein